MKRCGLLFKNLLLSICLLCVPFGLQAQDSPNVVTAAASGLRTTTFDTLVGTVTVNLPDDVTTGDTISGSVVTDPKGKSDAERASNQSELNGFVVEADKEKVPTGEEYAKFVVPAAAAGIPLILKDREGREVGRTVVPVKQPTAELAKAASQGVYETPSIGQPGKPIVVKGAFDGNSSSSGVTIAKSAARILAESPRQLIAAAPADAVGSTEIEVTKNGKVVARCSYQSVMVRLSAGKVDLKRGEGTTMTVTLSGLDGSTTPVQVELLNRTPGAVLLKGGDTQYFTVDPKEVKNGGYVTTRSLTGIRPGGFSISAIVQGGGLKRCGSPDLPDVEPLAAGQPPPDLRPHDDTAGHNPEPLQEAFRVTLTGFRVNTATIDGALVTDGAGDQVYAVAEVANVDVDHITGPIQHLTSLIYGDTMRDESPRTVLPSLTHRPRFTVIKAGRASSTGGLMDGDQFPEPGQPATTLPDAPPEIQARLIPMVLWEGVLRQNTPNENAVLILPTIWEDDNHLGSMLAQWSRQSNAFMTRHAGTLATFISRHSPRPLVAPVDVVLHMIPERNDFDRPVGMSGETYNPFAASPGEATFSPSAMVLTLASAEAAVATNRGVVPITYTDGSNYGPGSYTIFLLVERLR